MYNNHCYVTRSGGVGALPTQSFLLVFLHLGRTLGTVPLALHWATQSHALEVEPLDWTLGVVAPNHLAERHAAACAVSRFVRIDRHLHLRCERHDIDSQSTASVTHSLLVPTE